MSLRLALVLAAGLDGTQVSALAASPLVPPPGASSCSGCHGQHGEGVFAPLAGRPAEAIATALAEYRAGTRPASVMTRIARGFSEAESRAIADYLAQQPQGGP
ncbi:c-type cytochrome [Methylobacterium sp. ID0610]|uniref:c-type cytochrome n=1 Tax=Methylobacterium carpenticola TaxID=3344827 RepID=UPI0036B90D82